MAERHEDLFPELEPPPGGTTRLMARIAADERSLRRRRAWVAGLAGVTAAAIAVVIAVRPQLPVGPHAHAVELDPAWREAPALVSLGVGREMSEPVEIPADARGEMAAVRVPTDDPHVVFYLVGSTAP